MFFSRCMHQNAAGPTHGTAAIPNAAAAACKGARLADRGCATFLSGMGTVGWAWHITSIQPPRHMCHSCNVTGAVSMAAGPGQPGWQSRLVGACRAAFLAGNKLSACTQQDFPVGRVGSTEPDLSGLGNVGVPTGLMVPVNCEMGGHKRRGERGALPPSLPSVAPEGSCLTVYTRSHAI